MLFVTMSRAIVAAWPRWLINNWLQCINAGPRIANRGAAVGEDFTIDTVDVKSVCLAALWGGSLCGMAIIYFRGWLVLLLYERAACEQPVAVWLFCCQVLTPIFFVTGSCGRSSASFASTSCTAAFMSWRVMWSIFCFVCFYLLYSSIYVLEDFTTCMRSSSMLVRWVVYLSNSGVVRLFGFQAIACSAKGFLMDCASRRRSDVGRVADKTVIDKLDCIAFLPRHQSTVSRWQDSSCSVCLDHFNSDKNIKSLACCGNVFHQSCLAGWLRRSQTCPLCRGDIQVVASANFHGESFMNAR
eukprot:TRINITY_DN11343_c0_g1_i2.p1 TRINITY_DN11343_c0_g1~~TRINITY_DN11343_c0_g1_i2.p1  ORF type:complete len:299 (+),score=27.57 TRINITY_DN11343_c0_g1_i2:1-897(+)